MGWLDWLVLLGSMGTIAWYGIRKSGKSRDLDHYLKGGNTDRWFTVGLSVMATQASAITFLSATGQGYESGLGFAQFYFGLPIAIVVVCAFFIPRYFRSGVYTAYEYLEGRFGLKTRLLTASLFLISRAFAAGITIYAPAIVLSTLFNWSLELTCVATGLFVLVYTVTGGSKAVSITQKQQMLVIFSGMFLAFWLLLDSLPEQVGFTEALHLAGLAGKLELVNTHFDLNERYTLWSGLLGGFFLQLAYFGSDQSQVQRYITASNPDQSKLGLLFNALFKIPMQFFILLVGVMLFAFYQFNPVPAYFNAVQLDRALETSYRDSLIHTGAELKRLDSIKTHYARFAARGELEAEYGRVLAERAAAQTHFRELLARALPDDTIEDRDYVFLNYVLHHFPPGVIGLLLAVILSAALSSTASELNALASTSSIDFYRRLRGQPDPAKEVRMSRYFVVFWGVLAIIAALSANLFENLIQLVNIIGSLFYGTILGVFLCAFFIPRIQGRQVFIAAILAEGAVIITYLHSDLSYLWLNPIGAGIVVFMALFLSYLRK